MNLNFQKDAHGILITQKRQDGFGIVGRISQGRFYYGRFENKLPEETPGLTNLSPEELRKIAEETEHS